MNELTAFALRNSWVVKKIFAEKISGAKKNLERRALKDMISYVKENSIGKALVLELSRLGRDTLEVLKTVETLNSEGISVYIYNYHIDAYRKRGCKLDVAVHHHHPRRNGQNGTQDHT